MPQPVPLISRETSPADLRRAIVRLLLMLVVLSVLVVPVVADLPLGETTRTGLLAWLLVAVAMYWLYAGLGYQPLLLLQLILYSAAAALLVSKVGLVLVGIHRLSVIRRTARDLIIAGGVLSVLNLGGMLVALVRRYAGRHGSASPKSGGKLPS